MGWGCLEGVKREDQAGRVKGTGKQSIVSGHTKGPCRSEP